MVALGILPILLMFGSLTTAPLAGPPLPLDPTLAAIAPPKCLWYTSAAGIAAPDPNSTNQTERLFAEPEVQYFSTAIQEQLTVAIRRAAGSGPEQRLLASEIPKLIKALITLPLAVYVEDVEVTDEEVVVTAALVLNAGTQRAEIEAAINKLVELAAEKGVIIGTVNREGDETWSVMRVSMQTPAFRWGWQGNYFIFAVGDGTAEALVERMQATPPGWLTQLRSDYPVEREASLFYLNVSGILEQLRPFLEKEDAWPIVEKLGLTSLESLNSRVGFDQLGCVTHSHLVTDGQRDGLLSLLPYKPLSKRDLRAIPHDAMLAAAKRVDLTEVWDNILRLVEAFDPSATEKIDRGLWKIETLLGVNLKDDVLDSLDDTWIAYLPAGDLMTSWIGSAVAVRVKDAERLQTALQKLVAVAETQLPQGRRLSVSIRESQFQSHTLQTVNVTGQPFPIAPSWCVTDEWLIFGLMPQSVRAAITREYEDDNKSLADVPAVRDLFSANNAPAAIGYCDTPRLVRSLYPLLQIGAQMLSAQLQNEGFDLDASALPSPDAIIKHLRPSVTAMSHTRNGFHFHTQHSLPGGGSAVVMAPIAVGTLLPSMYVASKATKEVQGINNLKNLALATLNYESANGKFPTNIYDENGKALLSWRVQVLPYLEEGSNLYDQFHLDEPWDSSHNLPLAQQMPAVLASPTLPAGKTPYVALAGKETLFPGNEKMGFRHITDGSSNTILFVQASPDAAVTWTQPKDIDFDPTKPFQGLQHANRRFSAAMADGSCTHINLTIGEEKMRAYATRAGGEVIERE